MTPRSYERRTRPLRRRPPRLVVRPRVLIICEGTKTEPTYFKNFRNQEHNRLIDIIVDDTAGVPRTLVNRAVEIRKAANRRAQREQDANLRYDEIWCVCDVDAHPMLQEALVQARDNGILVAISNPCFELWLLLHFHDQTAHLSRHEAQTQCRVHLSDYEKAVTKEYFRQLQAAYSTAVRRAEHLRNRHQTAGSPLHENPSTTVDRLTERILELGFQSHIARIQALRQ